MAYITYNTAAGAAFFGKKKLTGICKQGVQNFIDFHKLDSRKRYQPRTILRLLAIESCGADESIFFVLRGEQHKFLAQRGTSAEVRKALRVSSDTVKTVWHALKDREINPSGYFDNKSRWYAKNAGLISCRAPSRAYPYSEMCACRTRKYVERCAVFHNCRTESELLGVV